MSALPVRRGRNATQPPWMLLGRQSTALLALLLFLLMIMTILILGSLPMASIFPSTTSTSVQHETNKTTATSVQFFSRARHDRAGGALLDMLLCHAFAWQEGVSYGGTCIEKASTKNDNHNNESHPPHIAQQEQLLQWLGLEKELPWACPHDRTGILMNRHDYFAQDTAIFTNAWLAHVRSIVAARTRIRRHLASSSSSRGVYQVAVHVRRGDVTACAEPQRFLPNSYYLALLDQYVLPKSGDGTAVNVTIYSDAVTGEEDAASSSSFEQQWQDFTQRDYTVERGTDLTQVWNAFINADVLILSKSSFSLVPALFNPNTVIYTPFWHKPLDGWTMVPQSLVDAHMKNIKTKCS